MRRGPVRAAARRASRHHHVKSPRRVYHRHVLHTRHVFTVHGAAARGRGAASSAPGRADTRVRHAPLTTSHSLVHSPLFARRQEISEEHVTKQKSRNRIMHPYLYERVHSKLDVYLCMYISQPGLYRAALGIPNPQQGLRL